VVHPVVKPVGLAHSRALAEPRLQGPVVRSSLARVQLAAHRLRAAQRLSQRHLLLANPGVRQNQKAGRQPKHRLGRVSPGLPLRRNHPKMSP
jgi:hypothetical protein